MFNFWTDFHIISYNCFHSCTVDGYSSYGNFGNVTGVGKGLKGGMQSKVNVTNSSLSFYDQSYDPKRHEIHISNYIY